MYSYFIIPVILGISMICSMGDIKSQVQTDVSMEVVEVLGVTLRKDEEVELYKGVLGEYLEGMVNYYDEENKECSVEYKQIQTSQEWLRNIFMSKFTKEETELNWENRGDIRYCDVEKSCVIEMKDAIVWINTNMIFD